MSLPFLPGNSFSKSLGKDKYHKSQHFDYNNEVAMMVGEHKPGIGGECLPGQKPAARTSFFPKGDGPAKPTWVAFDKQVLCFEGFFQEAVTESRQEQYRVRNVKIYFYLEDDSVQVIEPRLKNAGLPQGTLIRRHRIPRPPPRDDEYFTVEDFNVDQEITLYGKTFKITGCDDFTKNFLAKLGVKVNLPTSSPEDPYRLHRKALDDSMQPLRPYERYDTLKQFLDHDRHVLRFFCYWNDTDNMFGDVRELILHYYLADDTVEIREVIPPNAGRDAAPVFLKRGPLPKDVIPLAQPGEMTDRTVLNVFGPMGHGGRYILDSLKTGAVNVDTYKDSDLMLGNVVNVFGRKIVLTDCDEFTKEFYRTKYGISDFSAVPYKAPAAAKPAKQWPPYNGFGSQEDSLCSCQGLLPKPPKRDFIKFMEKDRTGLESHVLRFLAQLVTDKPVDIDRRFIISYFLSDDTMLIFEPPVRNSGIAGGKFLERTRVQRPGQEQFSTRLPEYYQAGDLFVGATIQVNNFHFRLINADDYAFSYMEQHAAQFPVANIEQIKAKLSALKKGNEDRAKSFFQQHDPSCSGKVAYDDFHRLMTEMTGGQLNEHEIMTLARQFMARSVSDEAVIEQLAARIQEHLRKQSFEDFGHMHQLFLHHDQERCGKVDEDVVRMVAKSLRMPAPMDLVRQLAKKLGTDMRVDYCELLKLLDWRTNPIVPRAPSATSGPGEAADNVDHINYKCLMEGLSSC